MGKPATLSVVAKGEVVYQWQKLLDGGWVDIAGANASTLAFDSVSYDDEGSYRCVVSNEEKRLESSSAKLQVAEIFIDSEPEEELNVYENTKTTLEVVARERNNNKLSYAWFVDKNDGKGFVKAGGSSKTIITPKANMLNWQYFCEISIGGETVRTSTSTIVSVKIPAKIVSNIKALEAFEGEPNSGFTVVATGDNLKYQWEISRDGSKTWAVIEGATSATYIPESDPSLNGAMYRCKVYNDGSSVYSASAKFTVREAPKVEDVEVLQNKIVLPFEGSTVVAYEDYPIDIKATAKGYKIKYQWYKNGLPIKGATKATYSIKKPLESQDSYFCEVYNGDV
ncbi:MAG: hypothetical protein IKO42_01280, partial [Opitutales bacterium]|nr:hypothetical protein [Opitutales bacterium]